MKDKTKNIIFFLVVLIIIIISFYYILDSNNNLEKQEIFKKTKEPTTKNIFIGISCFDTINPILSKEQDVQYISKLIYEPLIDITVDFKTKGCLAKEYAYIDEKTYLIKLDQSKKWSDGNPVSALDVEYTINYIKSNNSIFSENIKYIEDIKIIDEYTLKFRLKEKIEYFEYFLCFPIICNRTNIGTGEYAVSYIDQNEIILQNNNINKEITVKLYKNYADLYNAFSKGEVDLITTQNIDFEKYIGKIGYNKELIQGRNFCYLLFENIDKSIAEAIQKSINIQEIVAKLYNNMYIPAKFSLYAEYEFNIDKGRKLLQDDGWKYNRF